MLTFIFSPTGPSSTLTRGLGFPWLHWLSFCLPLLWWHPKLVPEPSLLTPPPSTASQTLRYPVHLSPLVSHRYSQLKKLAESPSNLISYLPRSSQISKNVFILLPFKLQHEVMCGLFCLESTMIMTSLVYTIQPSPACSSLLPVGYSTTKSTRASSCYSSVYNPTKGLHISLGPNPSILRLFSFLSSNISDLTNLVILTLQECLPFRLVCAPHLGSVSPSHLKSGPFQWSLYREPCPSATETFVTLDSVFSMRLILLISHPLASVCYSCV